MHTIRDKFRPFTVGDMGPNIYLNFMSCKLKNARNGTSTLKIGICPSLSPSVIKSKDIIYNIRIFRTFKGFLWKMHVAGGQGLALQQCFHTNLFYFSKIYTTVKSHFKCMPGASNLGILLLSICSFHSLSYNP